MAVFPKPPGFDARIRSLYPDTAGHNAANRGEQGKRLFFPLPDDPPPPPATEVAPGNRVSTTRVEVTRPDGAVVSIFTPTAYLRRKRP